MVCAIGGMSAGALGEVPCLGELMMPAPEAGTTAGELGAGLTAGELGQGTIAGELGCRGTDDAGGIGGVS